MKRLLKVTAMTGLLTLFKMLLGFIIAKVIAVYTGPSGLAMLGQVQSMVNSLNGIVNAPVGAGVVRYTAENHSKGFEECAPWWSASLQWVLIITLIIVPTGLVLSNYLADWLFQDRSFSWVIIVTVCVLPLSATGTLFNSVINGQKLYRRYIVLGFISVFVSACTMVTLIVMGNVSGALFAAAIQSSIVGVVMLLANIRQPWLKVKFWWGNADAIKRNDIAGYMLMAITSAIALPISLILIRNILVSNVGWEQAGYWQAVWKISEVYLSVLTIALSTYYLPKLASLSDYNSIIKEVNTTAKVFVPAVVIMAVIIYLLRDFIISLLFTAEFSSAGELFAVQLVGDVFKISSFLYAYLMLAKGRTKVYILSEIFFSITFFALSFIFIKNVGLQGVTYAYALNYLFYFVFAYANRKKFILN
ncbi:O-antigen translocase [Shewanella sp. SM73]|uniref:O-antigen translocase n=1 Tax=Shewanella sp. SM73 TaxID=2912806 RepID=UPI0021D98C61|nr:O-antigen translocase [Shewanella sp. SM73]MCU8031120.1 O-antigen translocase [Shewanella sp. SM73]